MNKKIFSLIIVSSLIAQPLLAQEIEDTPREKQAYNLGLKKGIAGTIAASSVAMIIYILSTIKEGLYIPAKINCKQIFDGYEWEWRDAYYPLDKDYSNFKRGSYCTRQPKYKTVCNANPLFQTMHNTSGELSINGTSVNVQENMIQKISNYMPHALMIGCVCTFFGALWYLTPPKKQSDADVSPLPPKKTYDIIHMLH